MAAPSVNDFAGYTMPELVKLCNENGVKGHSKKKVHEIVDLLIHAGVHPVKKEGALKKKGRPLATTTATTATTAVTAPDVATATVPEDAADDAASTSSTSSHEYIFRASWRDVLKHLEDGSAQLAIADSASSVQVSDWITESLRVLEDGGLLVVRGLHPQAVPASLQNSQWMKVGTESLLVVTKGATAAAIAATAATDETKSVTGFYESLISNTRADATILVPFAGNGDVCKLVRKHRRSFVTMDDDENRIARLYKIVH